MELEVLLVDELAESLETDECCVPLVAVVNLWVDTDLAESADTADTKEELLLETVLPITTIKVVSDRSVFPKVLRDV